jgi:hypothetical protein
MASRVVLSSIELVSYIMLGTCILELILKGQYFQYTKHSKIFVPPIALKLQFSQIATE